MRLIGIEEVLYLSCAAITAFNEVKSSQTAYERAHSKDAYLADQYPVTDPSYGSTTNSPGLFAKEYYQYGFSFKQEESQFLDIGAAWRMVASMPLLKEGYKVTVVESKKKELEALVGFLDHLSVQPKAKGFRERWTKNLTMYEGLLPEKLNHLEDNSFNAVMLGSVLHFLDGAGIEASLREVFRVLKPGGKVFIEAQTPYMQGLDEWRKGQMAKLLEIPKDPFTLNWPWELNNREGQFVFLNSETKYLNLFDKDHVKRVLLKMGFEVNPKEVYYFTRDFQDSKTFHPEDRAFRIAHEGKPSPYDVLESVGGIGTKPMRKGEL